MPETNPYESPQVIDKSPDRPMLPDEGDDLRLSTPARVIAWTFLFAGNLVVCLSIGVRASDKNAIIGIGCALVCLYAVGIVGIMQPRFSTALVQGGILVGLTQFFPMLQLISGMIGLAVSSTVFPRPPAPNGVERFDIEIQGIPQGALTTLTAGVILMSIALAIGLLIRLVVRGRRERRNLARTFYK